MADRRVTVRTIRRAVAEVSRGERRNVVQLLRQVQQIRDSLIARLAEGGTEFDQATKRALLAEVDQVVARIRQEVSTGFDLQFQEAARKGLEEMSRQLVAVNDDATIPALVGLDLDVLDFVRQETDNLVRGVSERVRQDIQTVINSGAIGTATRQDVIAKLGTVLSREGRPEGTFGRLALQVERIHRTETSTIFSLSKKATANKAVRETGRQAKKRWVAVGDARMRAAHRALNGVEIPFDEHFNVGPTGAAAKVSWEEAGRRGLAQGEKADVPLDPALSPGQRIQCRCSWALVLGDPVAQTDRELLGIG